MTFSERYGLKPKKAIQIDSMDDALRNSLWNILVSFYWDIGSASQFRRMIPHEYSEIILSQINRSVVTLFFKERIDIYQRLLKSSFYEKEVAENIISECFFSIEWYRVYDLIEFIISQDKTISSFEKTIKDALLKKSTRCLPNGFKA